MPNQSEMFLIENRFRVKLRILSLASGLKNEAFAPNPSESVVDTNIRNLDHHFRNDAVGKFQGLPKSQK